MTKMKAVIVLNGEPSEYEFKDTFVICCDGALRYLEKIGVKPDLVLGDFDSLGYVPLNAETFPVEKDFTDGELALYECEKRGYKEVDFICAGGGRDDHFLGNLALLRKACSKGILARLFTENSVFYCTDKPFKGETEKGGTVSVIAVDDSFIESSYGLKYPYKNREIKRESTLGVSNVATDGKFFIGLKSGRIFVIINRKPV